MKTNTARLLDSLHINYALREYEVDPEDLGAEGVVAKIGMPAEQVFKTLVARGTWPQKAPVFHVLECPTAIMCAWP